MNFPKFQKVVDVIDGDTFKTKELNRSIRLANVDTPELAKSSGESKSLLKKAVKNVLAQ